MCTLADMAEMPKTSAVEFLQKESAVAEILQVNSKSLVLPKIHIFSNRISFKIKLLTSRFWRSGSTLKTRRREPCS